jgi:MazG family protein
LPPLRKSSSRRSKTARSGRRKIEASAEPKLRLTRRDNRAGEWFAKLVALQDRLRGPEGCPWDREQTHETLRKFLVEETYEVLDAMDSGDAREFSSELGDLLLQIIFHSILAEETGGFTISDVIESVFIKMVRRHPHVFGDAKAQTSADVLKNWEQIKAAERAEEEASGNRAAVQARVEKLESVLNGVPRSLPAVLEAYQLTRRASHVGFDWDHLAGIFDKLDEEKRELASLVSTSRGHAGLRREAPAQEPPGAVPHGSRSARGPSRLLEEEAGDLLFTVVNVARFLGVDPEIALKKANAKFKRRFVWMESAAAREGQAFANIPRPRMEELWNESKGKA